MVITILEAEVEPDRIPELEQTYQAATGELPPEIVETFLMRDAQKANCFRIMTVWTSREALEKIRAMFETPRGVQMFESVGARPELSIFEVVARLKN